MANNIATFAPTANLAINTLFTATITTGAKDLSGTSLASSFIWTFTTGATTAPPHPHRWQQPRVANRDAEWQSDGAQCVGDHGKHRDQRTFAVGQELDDVKAE
jgi:hypothetical protein